MIERMMDKEKTERAGTGEYRINVGDRIAFLPCEKQGEPRAL